MRMYVAPCRSGSTCARTYVLSNMLQSLSCQLWESHKFCQLCKLCQVFQWPQLLQRCRHVRRASCVSHSFQFPLLRQGRKLCQMCQCPKLFQLCHRVRACQLCRLRTCVFQFRLLCQERKLCQMCQSPVAPAVRASSVIRTYVHMYTYVRMYVRTYVYSQRAHVRT